MELNAASSSSTVATMSASLAASSGNVSLNTSTTTGRRGRRQGRVLVRTEGEGRASFAGAASLPEVSDLAVPNCLAEDLQTA